MEMLTDSPGMNSEKDHEVIVRTLLLHEELHDKQSSFVGQRPVEQGQKTKLRMGMHNTGTL